MDYEIRHWGIKDQKWGRRRYQNPDGSYTEEGKARRRKDYVADVVKSEDKKNTAKFIATVAGLSLAAIATTSIIANGKAKALANAAKPVDMLNWSEDAKEYAKLIGKDANTLSTSELAKIVSRKQQIDKYSSILPRTKTPLEKIATTTAAIGGVTAAINGINSFYNSGNNLVKNGQDFVKKFAKK